MNIKVGLKYYRTETLDYNALKGEEVVVESISRYSSTGRDSLKDIIRYSKGRSLNRRVFEARFSEQLAKTENPAAPKVSFAAMKDKPTNRFKVFDKNGNIDAKGIVYQRHNALTGKSNVRDFRPFVEEAYFAERNRVVRQLLSEDLKGYREQAAKNCDVELYDIANHFIRKLDNLDNVKATFLEGHFDASDIVKYYTLRKLSAKNTKYSWINDYITVANVQDSNPVTLYTSNKQTISLVEGSVVLVRGSETFRANLAYNEETKSFEFKL